jgi:chemotaxis protein MotB
VAKPAKKPPEAKKGAPLWMATFSDMVTLLLTFFVLLVSMASFEDKAKSDALAASLKDAFGIGGDDIALIGKLLQAAFPSAILVIDDAPPPSAEVREGLKSYIESLIPPGKGHEEEMRISLSDTMLFAQGSFELSDEHRTFLSEVARLVRDLKEVSIEVEGHADPTGDAKANRRLAGERALAVADALRTRAIDGSRLAASTRGEYSPGTTEGGDSAYNRRVDLVFRGEKRAIRQAMDRLTGVEPLPNSAPNAPEAAEPKGG